MSLMRTSVITTVVLLISVAHSRATQNHVHLIIPPGNGAGGGAFVRSLQSAGDAFGLARVAAEGEEACPAAAHHLSGRPLLPQAFQPGPNLRPQSLRHLLQAVVQPPPDLL